MNYTGQTSKPHIINELQNKDSDQGCRTNHSLGYAMQPTSCFIIPPPTTHSISSDSMTVYQTEVRKGWIQKNKELMYICVKSERGKKSILFPQVLVRLSIGEVILRLE